MSSVSQERVAGARQRRLRLDVRDEAVDAERILGNEPHACEFPGLGFRGWLPRDSRFAHP
jgi:hypothetical protein